MNKDGPTKSRLAGRVLAGLVGALIGVGLAGSPAVGGEAKPPPDALKGPIKVGIVDLRRAFQESKAVKVAKEELVQERNEKLQALKNRQQELKSLLETIQKNKELLSDVVRRQKEAEFRRKRRSFERMKSDAEQELNRQFLSINRLFVADAQKELVAMGRDFGYTLIVDVNNDIVLYGSDTVDLTDELIKRLNDHQWSQR